MRGKEGSLDEPKYCKLSKRGYHLLGVRGSGDLKEGTGRMCLRLRLKV